MQHNRILRLLPLRMVCPHGVQHALSSFPTVCDARRLGVAKGGTCAICDGGTARHALRCTTLPAFPTARIQRVHSHPAHLASKLRLSLTVERRRRSVSMRHAVWRRG